MINRYLPVIGASLVTAISPSFAQTLLDDTFEIPAGAATIGDDAADPNDTAWWKASATAGQPALAVVSSAAVGSDVLEVTQSGRAQPLLGSFPAATLANVGDKITLTVSCRQLTDLSGGLRFCLYDSNGTPTGADNDGSSENDEGYFLNLGTPTGTGNGSTNIAKETEGVGPLFTQDNTSILGTSLSTGLRFGATTVHDVTFSIELTAPGTVTISGTWTDDSNGNSINRTDSTDPLLSFDQAVFGFGAPGTLPAPVFELDDIRVVFEAGTATAPDVTITDFTALGGGQYELSILGDSASTYQLASTPDLDFTASSLIAYDSVSTGTAIDATTFQPAAGGVAVVRVTLAGPRNFLRAETVTTP